MSFPSKIADIVIELLDEKEPPFLRLLVGPDAVEYEGQAGEALSEADRKWRDLSVNSA